VFQRFLSIEPRFGNTYTGETKIVDIDITIGMELIGGQKYPIALHKQQCMNWVRGNFPGKTPLYF
jgi:hypothetical protein